MSASTADVWFLEQAVDGHDGKELVDSPGVRDRLKEREIAEIRIGEQALQAFKLLRHLVHLTREAQNFLTNTPKIVFSHDAFLQT